ncbi:hypothetical protein ACFY19_20910 [Streptosporangium saharense]|uniref:hypothetical protein n=1 Tax=Streptosporangium saharense TaxID=1706840 RepID=UPI00367EF971
MIDRDQQIRATSTLLGLLTLPGLPAACNWTIRTEYTSRSIVLRGQMDEIGIAQVADAMAAFGAVLDDVEWELKRYITGGGTLYLHGRYNGVRVSLWGGLHNDADVRAAEDLGVLA